MENEILFQLALTQIPQIGSVHAKILIRQLGTAAAIFKSKKTTLEKIEGIGEFRAHSIAAFSDFSSAEEELLFMEKFKISPLFITDADYPQRLLNCYDPPALLFYKGSANLNVSRVVAIVGTRRCSEYGRQMTEKIVHGLAATGVLIASGLAYGIDALAHKNALRNNLPTVGVLAHGMAEIYPPEHSMLAHDMLSHGGLLTEFRSITRPDRHHFPTRNRIVAGMSDCTVVVETGLKGGSMITAELANGYNRDVFAFPGKTTDGKSAGCNALIKNNKAVLLTDAVQLLELMGWNEKQKTEKKKQKELFIELDEHEKILFELLLQKEPMHIDELNLKSKLSNSAVASAILNLELKNVVISKPGKMYGLI